MDHYFLYIIIASATIASPGPGVLLTITNAIRYGFVGSIPGVIGVASGMLCIAAVSATSLAVILATSALSFSILKLVGAAYLIYLGVKMWKSTSKFDLRENVHQKNHKARFSEGLLITLLNPKPIFFFTALFPQFIAEDKNYQTQFFILAITFSLLVVIIHCIYAAFSKVAKSGMSTAKSGGLFGKIAGSFYMFFGIGLAASNK